MTIKAARGVSYRSLIWIALGLGMVGGAGVTLGMTYVGVAHPYGAGVAGIAVAALGFYRTTYTRFNEVPWIGQRNREVRAGSEKYGGDYAA